MMGAARLLGSLADLPFVLGAVVCFSLAPVLARLAQPFTPWQIASFRTLVGAAIIGGLVKMGGGRLRLSNGELRVVIPMGILAGATFVLFFVALHYGSIALCLTLSYLSPVFIALGMRLFFKEPVGAFYYWGMALVLTGIGILTGFAPDLTRQVLLAGVLAVLSGACWSCYSILGGRVGNQTPLPAMAFWVYLIAGLCAAPVGLREEIRILSVYQIGAVILLGAIPLVVGQTLYLAAIRKMHPARANAVCSLEVVGGSFFGWLALNEALAANAIIGASLVQLGVVCVLWDNSPRKCG